MVSEAGSVKEICGQRINFPGMKAVGGVEPEGKSSPDQGFHHACPKSTAADEERIVIESEIADGEVSVPVKDFSEHVLGMAPRETGV